MPRRKEQFANNEVYHTILKGIDGNLIFKDINDYYRGIFSIYEFNDLKPANIKKRREIRLHFKEGRGRPPISIDKRERLLDILCFCFMPNHIHLLLRQITDGGINKFMLKLGTGYAGYFNRRYKRKGYVFQNRFSSVHIKSDEQLKIVFAYIHTNPLSLVYPEWKKIKTKKPEENYNSLEIYKWSSCLDYIGIKNFPSVIERDFILNLMGGFENCKDFMKYWINYKGEPEEYYNLFLE